MQKHNVTVEEAEKAVRRHFKIDKYPRETQRRVENEIRQWANGVAFLANVVIGGNDAETTT